MATMIRGSVTPRLLALSLAMLLAACGATTGPDVASAVAGTWTYTGTEEAPDPATLSGTLSLHGVSGADGAFEGTFTILEQAPTGTATPLAGTTAGNVISDSIADFDLIVGTVARRHIGVLRGDSISGSWASMDGGTNESGKFTMRRSGTS